MASSKYEVPHEIPAVEDRRYATMLHGDVACLSAMFGNGLIYMQSSVVREDGREYLHGLADGTNLYRTIEYGIDQTVRLADSVLVHGWPLMTLVSGSALRELDNLSFALLSKVEGDWKLFAHVSPPRNHPVSPDTTEH